MVLNITSNLPPTELMQFTRKVIKNELEKKEGVAVVQLSGGREREILAEIDQGRLQATGVSVVAVADALNKANLNYPAGTIEESFYEYLIRTIGEFKVVKEISNLPVAVDERPLNLREENPQEQGIRPPQEKKIEKRLILLSDIAKVKDTMQEQTSISRYNGKDTISLSVIKQAGANTLWVSNNIKATLKELRNSMPGQVKITVTYDQSQFIQGSIAGVRDAAMQGGFLAFIVLLFFLRRVVSSLIVTLSIPISILGVFSMMYFSNISLNMISLGGLALGVGMLVDCAIVVIENIYRHIALGKTPQEASVAGTNEVNSALWGSTLTTQAVFFPMIFVVGIAGQLFKELAFTVIASLMISLFVALTLIPILISKEVSKRSGANLRFPAWVYKAQDLLWNGLVSFIKKLGKPSLALLKYVLNHRTVSLCAMLIIFIFSLFMLSRMDWELLPRIDQGQFVIKVNLPPGTRLAVTDSVVKKIENRLFALPEIQDVTISIGSSKEKTSCGQMVETLGSNQAQIMVSLKPLAMHKKTKYTTLQALLLPYSSTDPKKFRVRSTSEILQELKSNLERDNLYGAEIEYILQESIFQMAFVSSAPVVIEIKGQNLDKLKKISEDIQERLNGVKGVYSIRSSLVRPAPEAKVYIRKDRAVAYNLSVSDIALTAQTAMKGYVATKFKEQGREIDIRVRLRPKDRADINKVRRLVVHSPLDIDVPLAEVAYMSVGKGPSQIQRLGQQRVILISANVYKRPLKEVIDETNVILDKIKTALPPDYSAKLTGENLQMKESFASLRFALILSLVLVYMIMAAEFESLWQPFVILFTFPLSIIGVALGLWLTHTPISIMVILGIIILGGIVVDNSIVLIEYVNQLRAQGNISLYNALIEASRTRLRPIMMTALTTILGLLPLAIGLAEGAEIQIPMAVTVMAGLTISTFLSLVIIPALYLSFENFIAFVRNIFMKEPQPAVSVTGPSILEIAKPSPRPVLETKPVIRLPQKPLPKPAMPAINLPHQPLPPEKDILLEALPEKYRSLELTKRQKELVLYLLDYKKITRLEYTEKFGISIITAARDLKDLLQKGLIKAAGPKATGRYYILVD